MKKFNKFIVLIASFLLLVSCQEEDKTFGDLSAPTNLNVEVQIQGMDSANPYGDGTGIVQFTTTADNAISYKYIFSDGTSQNAPSGIFEKRFTQTGVNVYGITVLAYGRGGVTTMTTLNVEVRSDFTDDEAVHFLTGGAHKNWYWSASEPGHLGVGPNSTDPTQNYYPFWYQAAPWEKAGSPASSCLYENVLKFSLEGNLLKYELDNGGNTFFNAAFNSVVGASSPDDGCYALDVSGVKTVSLSPSTSNVVANNIPNQTRGTMMNFSDNGFMGYYIGQSSYEIISITENRMVVRAVMGGNDALAWYHTFTTINPVQDPTTDYTTLVWSDEFDVDGAPNPSKWGYDIGAGGWGNQEAQYYTNNPSNVIVQGGNLKITAKAENLSGSSYTSARIKSENKFEFTYGKVEIRAKLPSGGGTWPALWMLGENYATNMWPACGEIDIMEHKGNVPNEIHGTVHYSGGSGGNGPTNSITIAGATSQFHVYKAIWTPNSIRFYVDNVLFHTVANNNSLPFNSDFFLIFNVAMGGTFGGNIDPAFSQSAMEVDYVRVYQ